MTFRSLIPALAALVIAAPAGGDLATDRQVAVDLARGRHLLGQVVELQAAGQPLRALHRPSQRPVARGAVILLHGPRNTVDGVRVIRPLRLGLAEAGWETLSLQLPSALPTEPEAAWLARNPGLAEQIAAAVKWLAGRGQRNQVVLAEGASAAASLRYAAAGPAREVTGLVIVSSRFGATTGELETLSKLELPLLDLVAEHDAAGVLETTAARQRALANRERADYARREVTGANPGFARVETALLATVRAWLASRVDGRESRTPR